jgi:hypothetical protein
LSAKRASLVLCIGLICSLKRLEEVVVPSLLAELNENRHAGNRRLAKNASYVAGVAFASDTTHRTDINGIAAIGLINARSVAQRRVVISGSVAQERRKADGGVTAPADVVQERT